MKKERAVAAVVFMVLMLSAVGAGLDSIWRAGRRAQGDVDRALAAMLTQCEPYRIDVDTLRIYRNHIEDALLRDTAYIAVSATCDDSRQVPALRARTGLTMLQLWQLSDQRASGMLAALAALWLALSLWRLSPNVEAVVSDRQNTPVETIIQSDLRLTPMQRQLMEMFLAAPEHRLAQRDICNRLWPKKPDASATLYTLIRRIKPVIDEAAGLTIECRRGESYQLKAK